MPQLVAQGLTKEFSSAGTSLLGLDSCSLVLEDAESLALVGPSGSGKSTLLALLGGLDSPSSGRLYFDGEELTTMTEQERTIFRRKNVGFVFQNHSLMPQCTALENVLLPLLADGRASKDDIRYATELLAKVGLEKRMDHFPNELSGGECQRVALVRALIRHPRLLLADEPTGNLDRAHAESVAKVIFELTEREQVILILATHDLQLAAQCNALFDLSLPPSQRKKVGGKKELVHHA